VQLLSQFKHENIVTFFGDSFEQQPKYIVVEFLERGDWEEFPQGKQATAGEICKFMSKNYMRQRQNHKILPNFQDQEPLQKMGFVF
jgi:hypothetical protein